MKHRRTWFGGVVLFCLFLFEMFSYSSSREALYGMTGVASWSTLIAFTLCAVDFAGLGRLLLPGDDELKDAIGMLFAAWILSAVGDTFLTYIVIAHDMSGRAGQMTLVNAGVISYSTWTIVIPIAIAVLVWLIQVALVSAVNSMMPDSRPAKKRDKSPEYPIRKLT